MQKKHIVKCKVVHPSCMAHKMAMTSRFVSAQPDTSLHCKTTDTVCLFTPQLLPALTVPTHQIKNI